MNENEMALMIESQAAQIEIYHRMVLNHAKEASQLHEENLALQTLLAEAEEIIHQNEERQLAI